NSTSLIIITTPLRSTLFPYTTLFRSESIALAKAKGKYVQQPKLGSKELEQAQAMIDMGIPKTQVAATLEVSRQTLYNALQREFSDRKSTRLNSSHVSISYAVFCLKKK